MALDEHITIIISIHSPERIGAYARPIPPSSIPIIHRSIFFIRKAASEEALSYQPGKKERALADSCKLTADSYSSYRPARRLFPVLQVDGAHFHVSRTAAFAATTLNAIFTIRSQLPNIGAVSLRRKFAP
jgi:hypothetical protein